MIAILTKVNDSWSKSKLTSPSISLLFSSYNSLAVHIIAFPLADPKYLILFGHHQRLYVDYKPPF